MIVKNRKDILAFIEKGELNIDILLAEMMQVISNKTFCPPTENVIFRISRRNDDSIEVGETELRQAPVPRPGLGGRPLRAANLEAGKRVSVQVALRSAFTESR